MEILVLILLFMLAITAYFIWQLRKRLNAVQREYNNKIRHQANRLAEKDQKVTILEAESSALMYKKSLFLTLANAAYDVLIIVNEDCNIIATNTSAEVLFDHQHIVGKSLIEVSGVEELHTMVQDALTKEAALLEEQIHLGEEIYRVRITCIRRNSHLFIALVLRDISQLVRLNRARRDMVANISHELRTPIANIRVIIDGLFHEQDKPKRKDSIQSLRDIARETEHLLWLVQEMSDLSMIESGQSIVRMVDVPLTMVVDESIERMREQSERRNVSVVRHIPDNLHVLCDRDLAQRVVVNLLHNALKWSPEEETITVNAVYDEDQEEVIISVLDNGPGVPEEAVDRIFERFYQVDASRSVGEGTGLGLAICRHIVEAHGGRIWADSNKDGRGGCFRFTLLYGAAEERPKMMTERKTKSAKNSIKPRKSKLA